MSEQKGMAIIIALVGIFFLVAGLDIGEERELHGGMIMWVGVGAMILAGVIYFGKR